MCLNQPRITIQRTSSASGTPKNGPNLYCVTFITTICNKPLLWEHNNNKNETIKSQISVGKINQQYKNYCEEVQLNAIITAKLLITRITKVQYF